MGKASTLAASKIAELSDVSRPTINQLFFKLRTRIAQLCDASSPFLWRGWSGWILFWSRPCSREERAWGRG